MREIRAVREACPASGRGRRHPAPEGEGSRSVRTGRAAPRRTGGFVLRGPALAAAFGVALGTLWGTTPGEAHPKLLFSEAEIPALRARITTGTAQSAFNNLCGGIGWWDDWYYDPWLGRCLEEVAFRYSMTGESWYADDVISQLVWLTAADPEGEFDADNLAWFGAVPIPIAMAYDMVYAELEPSERNGVVAYLEGYGELLFAALDDGTRPALRSEDILAYAGLGLLGIAIEGESSHPDRAGWVSAAAERIRTDALRDAWNPGGAFDGGYGLSVSGPPEALRFAEAYERSGGDDLLAGSNLLEAPDWYAYGWLSHAAHPALGYPTYLTGQSFAAEHLLTVRRTSSSIGKWAWNQMHGITGIDAVERPTPLSGLLGVVLWYPEEIATIADPTSAGLPLDRWFHDTANVGPDEPAFDLGAGGLVVLRSGWGYDSVALLLKVSDEWQPESHNDSSSFVLSAYGVEMAMDPPAATLARRSGHNVVQIGERDDDAAPRASYRGALGSLWSTSFAAVANADSRYPSGAFDAGDPDDPSDDVWSPVTRADRTVIFVRSPRPYVLVADDVNGDGATAATARWHMQLGLNSWGLSGGSGDPFDPLRVEFYNGQQLLVSVIEPSWGYLPTVSYVQENPWHQRLTVEADPRVDTRFLVMLQPRRWAGDPEQPWVTRLAATGGLGVDLAWSDGSDRLLLRTQSMGNGPMEVASDGTSTDARLLLLRTTYGVEPAAWLASDATRVVAQGLGLLDTGGIECSVSWTNGRLEVTASEPPAPRQIAVYAPFVADVRLDGEAVGFVQAGSYVLLPAECALEERCNRIDDDCDGLVDEDDAVDAPSWYVDEDGDGYGNSEQVQRACTVPAGYVSVAGDCDDEDRHVHPGALEDCSDSDDNDCNGKADEDDPVCIEAEELADTTMCTCSVVGRARGPGDGLPTGWLWVAVGSVAWAARRRHGGGARRAARAHAGHVRPGSAGCLAGGSLLAAASLLAGCGTAPSRVYAVTLTESGEATCTAQAIGLLADPVALEEAADDMRRQWKSAYESAVLRPEPRTLRVNELETRVQAWLEQGDTGCPTWAEVTEPPAGSEPEIPAYDTDPDTTDEEGICSAAAFAYDDPSTVYEGEPQSDYVQASFVDAVNTDEPDEAEGLYPCGPRALASGVLSVTHEAGASGRIRWTHTRWIRSEYSSCEARIDCARNIAIEGLEVE